MRRIINTGDRFIHGYNTLPAFSDHNRISSRICIRHGWRWRMFHHGAGCSTGLLVGDGLDSTLAIRVAFATGLAVTLPTVMTSALGHHRRGAVDWQTAIPMGITAVVGAVTGGTIATYLPGQVLKTFFAVLVTLMAVRMLWNVKECSVCPPRQSLPVLLFIGFCIGNITSLAGVGGGVVLVPILILLLHYPVHTAIGTSSACLIFSSAGASSNVSLAWTRSCRSATILYRIYRSHSVGSSRCNNNSPFNSGSQICTPVLCKNSQVFFCCPDVYYRCSDAHFLK